MQTYSEEGSSESVFLSLFTSSCTSWAQKKREIREEEARSSLALVVVSTESSVSGRANGYSSVERF